MTLQSLREEVLEANLDLVRQQLVVFTFGNASGFDRDSGRIVIKPSGVAYDKLSAADLVVTDIQGQVLEGTFAAFVRSADACRALSSFPGRSRRCPHPFEIRHRVGSGRPGDSVPGYDTRGLFSRTDPGHA